ncbi:MAG TPA: periplasmic heavy metal sensor [Thermoanaerobaculia bacterium]|nr:periplasmic heavy metal sensor [Thermoanaerobaculia bacterium]
MAKRILILVALTLTLAVVPLVYAQHHGGMHGAGMHGDGDFGSMPFAHLLKAKEALGLSDEQVTQIKGIFTELREQNAPYRTQLHDSLGSITKTLLANPNDTAAATTILDQQNATERVMKLNALSAFAKALNVLTPEQRTKAAAMLNEHLEQMHSRR